MEQAWLYSSAFKKAKLHNVFVVSLTGEIELVCLINAEHTLIISTLCDLLKSLEKLGELAKQQSDRSSSYSSSSSSNANQIQNLMQILKDTNTLKMAIDETNRIMQKLGILFTDLIFDEAEIDNFVFLSNIDRTKKLIVVSLI